MSRIPAELLGVYALSSVFVAMMGLYAVTAYSVIERHREFALRIALGSTRGGIFRLVLKGATSVVLVGLVTGGLDPLRPCASCVPCCLASSRLTPSAIARRLFFSCSLSLSQEWFPHAAQPSFSPCKHYATNR